MWLPFADHGQKQDPPAVAADKPGRLITPRIDPTLLGRVLYVQLARNETLTAAVSRGLELYLRHQEVMEKKRPDRQ
jgi:hypothetical protein